MKFICKTEEYESPKGLQGIFKNPWVETTSATVDTEKQRLTVLFSLKYLKGDQEITLERQQVVFNETGIFTLIENNQGEEIEIIEFVTGGGTYDKMKITQWGIPSFARVQEYFDLDSVWSGLTIKDQPLKQLAIDWMLHNIKIEGLPLIENFDLEE